ncbi:hypothetical protein PS005_24365, partial [Shigella sonnei]|nr:hypothetical protein [Shigella sonnei]
DFGKTSRLLATMSKSFPPVNKRDVLPKSLKVGKLTAWLREQAASRSLKPKDILVTSAQNKDDVAELMEAIEYYRRGRDVYVVGVTNVG